MKNLLVAACVASLSIASAASARAQTRSDAAVPLARRLFNEGVEAARERQWQQSHDRFSRSYELAPRLLTLFNLAAAQLNTGRLVEANESYRQFLRESADGRYAEFREEASGIISSLEARIPYARIRILGIAPDDELTLDQSAFPQAGLNESLPLNPGPHTLQISRGGRVLSAKQFTLDEGDSTTIDLKVDAAIAARSRGPSTADPMWVSEDAAPQKRKRGGSVLRSPWFWGAVAVIAGGAGGYLLVRDRVSEPTAGTLGRGTIEF